MAVVVVVIMVVVVIVSVPIQYWAKPPITPKDPLSVREPRALLLQDINNVPHKLICGGASPASGVLSDPSCSGTS